MVEPHSPTFRVITTNVWVSEYLGTVIVAQISAFPEDSQRLCKMPEIRTPFYIKINLSLAIVLCKNEFGLSLWHSLDILFEPHRDKTNKMTCAPSADSDQPGHPPSLIRVFTVRMKKAQVLSYPLSATSKTLIRLGRCPSWSECLLRAHAIFFLVLSWGGSFVSMQLSSTELTANKYAIKAIKHDF